MHRRIANAVRCEPRRSARKQVHDSGTGAQTEQGEVMKNRRMIVIVCGTVLLIAAAVVVAMRERRQTVPSPDVPVAQTPAEVRVKAVERKPEPSDQEVVEASTAVAIVCGADSATADRYEARNDALRSIARRRDLPEKDVAVLIAYLRTADNAMRIERVAALKNDVMNLLRNQEPAVEGLAETLIAMIEGRPVAGFGGSGRAGVPSPPAVGDGTPSLPGNTLHPPVVIDYCIQHLGAVVNELDDAWRVGAHTSSDRFRGSLRSGDTGDRVLPVGKRSARVGVH